MNLSPYCLLEISVRDLPVLVPVQSLEDLVESLISHMYPPVVEVEFELLSFHLASGVLADVVERFSDSLPLVLNLFKDHLLGIILGNHLSGNLVGENSDFFIVAGQALFEGRILLRIMSEVEPLN